jgi:hypothetical protein
VVFVHLRKLAFGKVGGCVVGKALRCTLANDAPNPAALFRSELCFPAQVLHFNRGFCWVAGDNGYGVGFAPVRFRTRPEGAADYLMTTLVATLGLLPAALSNGIGAQTQKPLAIVVIGGSMILALLSRVRQPPLIVLLHRWFDKPAPQPMMSIPPPGMSLPPPSM